MKRTVWINKANGQLCVTVPKNSGIKEGEIVSVEKEKIRIIVYSSVTADLFHYGHLRLLEAANNLGDFHICGVPTNDAIKSFKKPPIADLKERAAIVSSLRCVDMVMIEDTNDPTKNLKEIHNRFKNAKIILVHGDDFKKVPGSEYIRKIGGEIVQPSYYKKLSTEKIVDKIFKFYGKD